MGLRQRWKKRQRQIKQEREAERLQAERLRAEHLEAERLRDQYSRANLTLFLEAGAIVAATPFLQAIATHFGNRFATGLDRRTRTALRRYLRRELRAQNERSLGPTDKIQLRTLDGWEVRFSPECPAEALAQLLALQNATRPELDAAPAPRLDWKESSWQVQGVRDGVLVEHIWDVESGRWSD